MNKSNRVRILLLVSACCLTVLMGVVSANASSGDSGKGGDGKATSWNGKEANRVKKIIAAVEEQTHVYFMARGMDFEDAEYQKLMDMIDEVDGFKKEIKKARSGMKKDRVAIRKYQKYARQLREIREQWENKSVVAAGTDDPESEPYKSEVLDPVTLGPAGEADMSEQQVKQADAKLDKLNKMYDDLKKRVAAETDDTKKRNMALDGLSIIETEMSIMDAEFREKAEQAREEGKPELESSYKGYSEELESRMADMNDSYDNGGLLKSD